MGVDSQNQAHAAHTRRRRPPATHRVERMARTRREIIDTGMALFAERGFDDVTTQEVADAAGVSTSTLFRYFPTKDSLLFVGEHDYIDILCEVFARQPASQSELDALFGAFVTLAPMMASVRRRVELYEKVIDSSALLRGRQAQHFQANVTLVARAIADRRGEPVGSSAELVAEVALTTLKRSHLRWLNGRTDHDLVGAIAEDREVLVEMLRGQLLK